MEKNIFEPIELSNNTVIKVIEIGDREENDT